MVGYTTFGTNDIEKAVAFYDALLGDFGAAQVMNDGRMVLYAKEGGAMFGICKPYDEKPASAGNGSMVAFNMGDQENVKKIYAKAISLGATDEGEPGKRGETFYGGYFRDADGNKFCAFCFGA